MSWELKFMEKAEGKGEKAWVPRGGRAKKHVGLNLRERRGLDGFCSLYPRQCLKIRHLKSRISDESTISICHYVKKNEARVRDFPSPRTLRSSGPWCPPSSDIGVQAAPLSPGPRPAVASSFRTKESRHLSS